jgi:hypothetical protein
MLIIVNTVTFIKKIVQETKSRESIKNLMPFPVNYIPETKLT